MEEKKKKKRYYRSRNNSQSARDIKMISRADWIHYIHSGYNELIELCTAYIEEYVRKYDCSSIELSNYDRKKHKTLSGFVYQDIIQKVNHIDQSLKLAQISLVSETGRGVYSTAIQYLKSKYEIDTLGISAKRLEKSFKPAFQVLEREIRYEAEVLFENSIIDNESFVKLKKQLREEDRRRSNMILDEIPENMPDIYPLARDMKRHFILHVGPTNSGKTYQALEALKAAKSGTYLAPLRLLAYEIYDRINSAGVPCNMITGEEEIIVPGASHTSSTIEAMSIIEEYEVAVIDECQLIGDRQRGGAWTKALLGICASTIHVCSDSSCVELVTKIIKECGDTYEIVEHHRNTPLLLDKSETFVFPETVREHDALIVFSKAACIAVAAELQDIGIKASMIYGNLPYDVRMSEVKRFISGETSVVVATDAIGMGLNLPIKRIVFLETRKFDGEEIRKLRNTEIKQIAGRAGRRGIFDTGYFTAEYNRAAIAGGVDGALEKVDRARLGIPESIIHLDMPLAEIMQRWSDIVTEDIYEKADLQEDIKLCNMLEPVVHDKKTLYDFLMIGFRTGRPFLNDLILECAAIQIGNKEEYDSRIDDMIDRHAVLYDEVLNEMSMEELEDLYLKYDLIYAFLRKFEHRKRMKAVIELKRSCSGRIIELLKSQRLESRRCKQCGTPLAWNYPYGLCRKCYRR